MNKGSYLLLLALPALVYTTDRLIAQGSKVNGYSVHPQQGNNGNLLDILASDTRALLSNAMLEKAEAYYHGGISDHGDCSAITGGACSDHDEHDKHDEHDEHPEPDKNKKAAPSFDPWAYLNNTLHAEAHIHLERDKAEELIPWYWAACEASPHNIQAFEATSYALASMLQQPQEALRLLETGITHNPNNVRLEITRGELLMKYLKDVRYAEEAFLAAYEKSVRSNASRDDLLKAEALFYLGYLAKKRNDLPTLRRWQAIAKESMSPELASIRALLMIE
jgi:tetratricopeptide (TPR) repeat protein